MTEPERKQVEDDMIEDLEARKEDADSISGGDFSAMQQSANSCFASGGPDNTLNKARGAISAANAADAYIRM